jgi:hypothetical protein
MGGAGLVGGAGLMGGAGLVGGAGLARLPLLLARRNGSHNETPHAPCSLSTGLAPTYFFL